MALLATGGEVRLHMARIIRAIEIILVATDAGGVRAGQRIIPVDVALRAHQGGVRSGQGEAGRGVVKAGVAPVGGRVALLAGLRHVGLHVIRVGCPFVILQVAGDASRAGEVVIVVHVTLRALQGQVRAGQREAGVVVIERRIRPGRGVVALLASLRKSLLRMVRVAGVVVIGQVAADAGRVGAGQRVVSVHVALGTQHAGMCSGQGEARGGVIKVCIRPRCCRVALLAILREVRLHVIGLRRSLEISQVAAHAGGVGAGQVVVAIYVALGALQAGMRAGKREARGRVIKGGICPRGGVVALLAGLRESALRVIRIGRAVEIFHVARSTSGWSASELAVHVTLVAGHVDMSARQWEFCKRTVIECRRVPGRRAVALLAGLREAILCVGRVIGPVEILQVAADAGRRRARVLTAHVAGNAFERGMRSVQREACES